MDRKGDGHKILLYAFFFASLGIISAEIAHAENSSILAVPFSVSNFSIASTTYQVGVFRAFNTTTAQRDMTLITAANIKQISGFGSNDVDIRTKVDGITVAEENLARVSGLNDETMDASSPIKFNVSQGIHNISVEFRRSGTGTVQLNDIDMRLMKFRSAHGNPIRNNLTISTYNHTSTSFASAFNWTINKNITSATFMFIRQLITATASVTADYSIQDEQTLATLFWSKLLHNAADTGAISSAFIHTTESSPHINTIQSRTSGGIVTVNISILDFDLVDNNSNVINMFQETNNNTNLSSTVSYSAGTYNIVNASVIVKNGTSYAISAIASFHSASGAQTPMFFVNSTQLPRSLCYSKKDGNLADNTERMTVQMDPTCSNLTLGTNYTFNLWATVAVGETLVLDDEIINGFETTPFDTTSFDYGPLVGEITYPTQGSNVSGILNITWLDFIDPDFDTVRYNISLLNQNQAFNRTINTSTNITSQLFNTSLAGDGNWAVMVRGCDIDNLCSNNTVNFTIDARAPAVSAISPTSGNAGAAINFNATMSDALTGVSSCLLLINNITNGTMTSNGTFANRTVTFGSAGLYSLAANCTDAAGNSNNSVSTAVTITDSPPFFNQTPRNTTVEQKSGFSVQINASDTILVDKYFVNDTVNFIMSSTGFLQNATALSSAINYSLNVTVNDTSNNQNSSIFTVFTKDTLAPSITSVTSSSIDTSSATISWTTDEPANASVNYGTELSLGTAASSTPRVVSQSVSLSGLSSSTLYYFNVTSCDATGKCAVNGGYNFTTSDAPTQQQSGGGGGRISSSNRFTAPIPQEAPNVTTIQTETKQTSSVNTSAPKTALTNITTTHEIPKPAAIKSKGILSSIGNFFVSIWKWLLGLP